jgi:hypothetical protein
VLKAHVGWQATTYAANVPFSVADNRKITRVEPGGICSFPGSPHAISMSRGRSTRTK